MSAIETLRPILAKYIVEPDSLQAAFDDPTTELFSLGLDSMGSFALLDDLAAEGDLPAIEHQAVAGGAYGGAAAGEDVDALVHSGAPPGLEPEGSRIPVAGTGAFDGYPRPFG